MAHQDRPYQNFRSRPERSGASALEATRAPIGGEASPLLMQADDLADAFAQHREQARATALHDFRPIERRSFEAGWHARDEQVATLQRDRAMSDDYRARLEAFVVGVTRVYESDRRRYRSIGALVRKLNSGGDA